jgi:hypothetical protein
VIFLLAGIAGLVMPALAYLAIALDGSRVSRERDGLADDLAEYHALVDEVSADLARIDEIDQQLVPATIPDIKESVQAEIDQAWVPFSLLRVLIGGLADQSPRDRRSLGGGAAPSSHGSTEAEAGPVGEIGTGLPGATTVDLQPLKDRTLRLKLIRARSAALRERPTGLPNHPWTKPSRPPHRPQLTQEA